MKQVQSVLRLSRYFLIACMVLFSSNLWSDEHTVGDVTIHYSALNTSMLTPQVASQYGITRSKQTGMINIAVQKKGHAVKANIFGNGKNLSGQLTELSFKEVVEGDAIYYLATYRINSGEKLKFDLQVQPEKKGVLIPLSFSKQLFVD